MKSENAKKPAQHNQPCFKTATLDLKLKWTEPHYFTEFFYFTLKTQKYKIKSLNTRVPGFQRFAWILRIVCELISCCYSESLAQVGRSTYRIISIDLVLQYGKDSS